MVVKKADNILNKITEKLKNNGIVIIPCDTIYGFVCSTSEAEEKIGLIKGREDNKPFIKLISSPDKLSTISNDKINNRILSLWPGPLTLIVNSLTGGTIAIRVPEDDFLIKILNIVNVPVVSTSVNRSGMPPLNKIKEIISNFENSVDLIVDGGDLENSVPSTILDVTKHPYKIIRQGKCILPEDIW